MNLNQLYYFSKLAEVEHYTKAAEALDISQPSLSHAIGSLEKELGTKLFEKQGRNVALTKYGIRRRITQNSGYGNAESAVSYRADRRRD